MIDHNVMGFDVAVHDAFAMAEVECFEQLKDVVAHIVVDKARVEGAEVGVVDVLEDQAGRLALAVSHHVEQGDNVWPARQVL